jgi:F-box protein 21
VKILPGNGGQTTLADNETKSGCEKEKKNSISLLPTAYHKDKLNAIVDTFFHDMKFVCDNELDMDKIDWKQLKNAYYLIEVEIFLGLIFIVNLILLFLLQQVLRSRKGKPILLAIIFEEISNRFNLSTEIISHHDEIYLRITLDKYTETH